MDDLERLQRAPLPFAALLGIRFTSATRERVTAALTVREELCTRPQILHGGALMAFADTLGAAATVLNLPEGAGTTTIESKTNFIAGAPLGTTIVGETLPLHRGRRTMVWQTRITDEGGRAIGVVTQTQMVLEPKSGGAPTLAALLKGKSVEEQVALLASLERESAAAYRGFAAGLPDSALRTTLLAAAEAREATGIALATTKPA
jgi:1,4-dihydroxy-2-naphthoyl-CoA hydrolase